MNLNTLRAFRDQSWPPKPTFTEKEVGDLTGKVHLITGGYSGIGLELAKILYSHNSTLIIAGRNPTKAQEAVSLLRATSPKSTGTLTFLPLDLSDFSSIRSFTTTFLQKYSRLDVLFNNAGAMLMPKEILSAQGYDMAMAVNCLGPYLLTCLLGPLLAKTAGMESTQRKKGGVRVVWCSSIVVDLQAPKGGMDLENLAYKRKDEGESMRYALAKAGVLFLGCEFARRGRERWEGVVHLVINPGNLKSPLQRDLGSLMKLMTAPMYYHAKFGAYTELWAGLSPNVKLEDSGRYVIPWGRFGKPRADIIPSLKSVENGGTGKAAKFFEYCERVTKDYLKQNGNSS